MIDLCRFLLLALAAIGNPGWAAEVDDCTRAMPSPRVSDVRKVREHSFELHGRDGTERITLANGERVVIRHGGCEHFVLVYQIPLAGTALPTTPRGWIDRALPTLRAMAEFGDDEAALAVKTLQDRQDYTLDTSIEVIKEYEFIGLRTRPVDGPPTTLEVFVDVAL